MRIGIIGAGLMGLALGQRLSAQGHTAVVLDKAQQPGGLTTYHDFGSFVWDRFYHVILPSDSHLLEFLRDIGLKDRLCWETTETGFYVDEKFYPLNDNLDFLKFPPLSLWSKFRLGLTILYCSRIDDWKRLEAVPVEDWLLKLSGRQTYEKLWKPLLLAKLGQEYKRVSAVFIWSYIKRMFSARDTSARKEQLGHVAGGYRTVFDQVTKVIESRGGEIRLNTGVEKVVPQPDGGIELQTSAGREVFDKVIFTGPVNILRGVADQSVVELRQRDREVEYLGVACGVLITSKPLMPYYILNIADDDVPFTGVIGMSNLVSLDQTAGRHITYLPKYVLSDDPSLQASDEELRADFMRGLRKMFPRVDDAGVEALHIHRAIKVQPLQVLGYSEIVPHADTQHPDFFVVNTSQFVNNTLNNNQVIKTVDEFLADHMTQFELSEGSSAVA